MPTDLPIQIKGFTITPVESWRVSCDACERSGTVVTGPNADGDALAWAQAHYRSYHFTPGGAHDAG